MQRDGVSKALLASVIAPWCCPTAQSGRATQTQLATPARRWDDDTGALQILDSRKLTTSVQFRQGEGDSNGALMVDLGYQNHVDPPLSCCKRDICRAREVDGEAEASKETGEGTFYAQQLHVVTPRANGADGEVSPRTPESAAGPPPDAESQVASSAAVVIALAGSGAEQKEKKEKKQKKEKKTKTPKAPEAASKETPILPLQRKLGAQSRRGGAPQLQLEVLQWNPHAEVCFDEFRQREEELCEDWAVFYHSYSFGALLYEVQAALASLLLNDEYTFNAQTAVLPRLMFGDFQDIPDADALLREFGARFSSGKADHHPEYRQVAISTMCSLVSLGPEVSTPVVFISAGYSNDNLSFRHLLIKLLATVCVPPGAVTKLADAIVELASTFKLDVSHFLEKKTKAGRRAGHMLQVFIRRDLVDHIAYSAHPWGHLDEERQPLSHWYAGDNNTNWGQARIVAHPKFFLREDMVRMFVASADKEFHVGRQEFQQKLGELLATEISGEVARNAKQVVLGERDAPVVSAVRTGRIWSPRRPKGLSSSSVTSWFSKAKK